jgi:hypothetical protein
LSALLPVGVEGIKQVIVNTVGGIKPATIAEQIQLEEAEINRIKALAELDNPGGTPSQWIVDLRASCRYITAYVLILGGLCSMYLPEVDMEVKTMTFEAANIAFGFLFGQRVTAQFTKGSK